MANQKNIHVFDVDGTITHHDSFLLLVKYLQPSTAERILHWASVLYLSVPSIVKGRLWKVKQALLFKLWKGNQKNKIQRQCIAFFEEVLVKDVRPNALQFIKGLKEKDASLQIVLLSASCKEWVWPLAEFVNADLICTELEYDNNQCYTGRFATPNCKGVEKVKRLLERYPPEDYSFICYGNSQSDKALQTISKQFFYRYF